ncbi:hypothetical protein ACFOZ7_02580 [Natribaculum luteum]|uniref:Uncharacterized protein n=1 Tax=Natribaculum luteum TaxID=1586232 RepID=A0ABD5NVW5_9EURY|nr:hypothetical protein [Natribaculum luteum]
MTDEIADERADQLISACRTAVGDQLRSLTYFTRDEFDQLYLRSDLERDADLAGFVDYESIGFDAHTAYRGSELGDYQFTIRVFDEGFLLRVTTETEGVFATTDGVTIQDFREAATALATILEGI